MRAHTRKNISRVRIFLEKSRRDYMKVMKKKLWATRVSYRSIEFVYVVSFSSNILRICYHPVSRYTINKTVFKTFFYIIWILTRTKKKLILEEQTNWFLCKNKTKQIIIAFRFYLLVDWKKTLTNKNLNSYLHFFLVKLTD